MNGTTFRMPARRIVTVAAATALAAGPAALAATGPAVATGGHGRADAVVLRTGLDVSLADKSVDVPLAVTLDEVHAPRSAEKTALTARLDGVDRGKPFSVLRADVATAKATVSGGKAEAHTELAHARLHVPGLPLLSLIELSGVTSTATCEAGKAPVASANLVGPVTVLGKRTTVSASGPTEVRVPGVGEVRLELARKHTTSRTAAATALELKVSVDPLKLNVAEVEGTVTLAEATCETPSARKEEAAEPAGDVRAQGAPAKEKRAKGKPVKEKPAEENLAETGGSATTVYLAGGSAVLLALGGAAFAVARRRG
ncbi:SCO1860 family LAETG-anchored protein [Streptomyces sp. NPDC008313]|uniref:SCO1860 family LAETG-anchored protein n=1 Tax=Streptomyces sp. NPDC008313 TaxID=3364826 RepID=UPI0036E3AE2E